MIVRYLTQDDVAEHNKITSQAFSYACDINDPDSVLPCEKVLGAFDADNKTLFADLEIHDRLCNYDGGILTCAAVGGVAAKPEHRGKGAVKALFDHLFRQTDCDVSILYPFSETYYRKLGYERAGFSVCASVPFSALSGVPRNSDVTLYEGRHTQRLLELYNRCARRYNLSFVRENADAFSDEPYASQKYTYIRKNDAFATIRIDREKSVVCVCELYYDSCESLRGILGFLRNFEANQKSVCFEKIPADSPVLHFVQDLKDCEIRVLGTGAVRILQIENVLKKHRYPAGSGTFTLLIGDDVFRVSYADDGVDVEKNRAFDPDATMDVATASRLLLCGFSDAAFVPGLAVHHPQSCFMKLFPPATTFFSDAL